ncbi:hypothetical protein GpartN1_g2876.t1 [Galdieria partita]|uniref:Amidohydrolase-related domain-containing protein n=1 Tax=Galdieria partita TaxID=83374 RepID=A0A9C7PVI4_9RHOD|nr:hypothetical protein GpartN1_g2876.t1 [Galdieria partita]
MKRENRRSWFYFACAAFILFLAILGNLLSGQKVHLTGRSKELFEQLEKLSRWKESKPAGSFAIKSTRILTPKGIRSGAILVDEKGVIDDIVDMIAVPPNWGPVLDYGRLLVMPGLIDVQTLDESIHDVLSTTQDGITSRLIYISDDVRDGFLLNNKSILKETFQWSLPNDSLSVGYIFTPPNSKTGFFVHREYFEMAKWCANHSSDHSHMSVGLCQSIPSFVEERKDIPNKLNSTNLANEIVSSPYQVPRVSSLRSLKKFCHSRNRSTLSFHPVCLYHIAFGMNFTSLKSVDEDIESCIDYFWNDHDCFGTRSTEGGETLSHLPKNKYRLPLAWTVAELAGISLNSFHSLACVYPANIFELHRKGKLEKGYDADIVVWSPEMNQSFPNDLCQVFEPLCHKMNYTLKGVVFETFVRGKRNMEILSWENGRGRHPLGR